MTAPRPITRQRVADVLNRNGLPVTEQIITELIEATKRNSSAPAAIQIVQEYAEYTPPKAFWESAQAEIKDLGLWEQVVAGYVAAGWNKQNLSGMFEFYRRQELPEAKGRKQNEPRPRSMNAVLEFMAENGITNG